MPKRRVMVFMDETVYQQLYDRFSKTKNPENIGISALLNTLAANLVQQQEITDTELRQQLEHQRREVAQTESLLKSREQYREREQAKAILKQHDQVAKQAEAIRRSSLLSRVLDD